MSTDPFFQRKPRRKPRSARALVTGALGLCAVGGVLWWGMPLRAGLWRGLQPFERMSASVAGAVGSVGNTATLEQQNTELAQEVTQLEARVVDRDELYRENTSLKKELGRLGPSASSTVLTGVLAAPPRVPYDTLLIDAGTRQGLATGDLVYAEGGALIGHISNTTATFASVTLFSSSGEVHQGMLNGTVPVTVEGDGEGALSTKVPADTPVSVGDSIVFPGIAGSISETVASIEAPAGDSFKTLYLHLPANISELQFVEVHRQSE